MHDDRSGIAVDDDLSAIADSDVLSRRRTTGQSHHQ
jgi:hypothetical protein